MDEVVSFVFGAQEEYGWNEICAPQSEKGIVPAEICVAVHFGLQSCRAY
jgi:hypothetical protein